MKKNFFAYFVAVLSAGLLMTSCDKEENGNGDPVCPVPEKSYAGSGLKLNYSNVPMFGKQVTFVPGAEVGEGAIILSGATEAAATLQAGAMPAMPAAGVIPGEKTTTLEISYEVKDNTLIFTGKDSIENRVATYDGTISAEELVLNLNVNMPNELVGKLELAASPIRLEWKADPFTFLGDSTYQMESFLKLALMMAKVDGVHTPSQALDSVFNEVTFMSDGNVQALYKDSVNATESKLSALNVATYKVEGNGDMRLYLNVAQIIGMMQPKPMNRAGIADVLPSLMVQVMPMVSEGIPMHYEITEAGTSIYLDHNVLKPILELFVPLVDTKEEVNAIIASLAAKAPQDMQMMVTAFLPSVLEAVPNVVKTTTDMKIGLNLTAVK